MIRTLTGFLLLAPLALADPIASSWFTDFSGQYARAFPTTAEEDANTPATTWDHPTGADQLTPTYSGVSEISTTATDLYIRTTGLAFHVMGPWYLNEADTDLFPNDVTLLLTLPTTPAGASGVPANMAVVPTSIVINGSTVATYISRPSQYQVTCTVPSTLSPPYTTAVVTFPNNPMTGATRVFTATQIAIYP